MNNRNIIGILILIFAFCHSVIAKEKEKQKIELPEKSLKYQVNRGVGNTMSWFYSGIAYAKSKGDTPEDFAKFGINAWKSWWKDFNIPAYLEKIFRCFSTDEDFKMEILKQTDTYVEVRMTIFGKRWMKVFSESWVTDDEYIRFL
jgi:hypothetical protein